MITRIVISLVLGMGIVVISPLPTVYAEDYLLRQTILGPVDPMVTPTVVSIEWTDGLPVISGTYDPVNTQQLRVQFFGVWYVLGTDSELTVNDGIWTLDLTNLPTEFAPGTYTAQVEATSVLGTIRATTTTTELQDPTPDPGPTPDPSDPVGPTTPRDPDPDKATGDLATTGQNIMIITVAASMFVIAAGGVMMWNDHKKRSLKMNDE